jgi:hypothetical protein
MRLPAVAEDNRHRLNGGLIEMGNVQHVARPAPIKTVVGQFIQIVIYASSKLHPPSPVLAAAPSLHLPVSTKVS